MKTKLYLEIKADTNDADYVTCRTIITQQQIDRLKPLIEAIKNNPDSHNWITSEYFSDDHKRPEDAYGQFGKLVEEFEDYIPYGEYGIHTIKSITLLRAIEEKLL